MAERNPIPVRATVRRQKAENVNEKRAAKEPLFFFGGDHRKPYPISALAPPHFSTDEL
jgi:arginase family enzyme